MSAVHSTVAYSLMICTLHAAIAHVITVLERQSLIAIVTHMRLFNSSTLIT